MFIQKVNTGFCIGKKPLGTQPADSCILKQLLNIHYSVYGKLLSKIGLCIWPFWLSILLLCLVHVWREFPHFIHSFLQCASVEQQTCSDTVLDIMMKQIAVMPKSTNMGFIVWKSQKEGNGNWVENGNYLFHLYLLQIQNLEKSFCTVNSFNELWWVKK